MLAVAGRVVDHPLQQFFGPDAVTFVVEQAHQTLVAVRRGPRTIQLPCEIDLVFLEKQSRLMGGLAAKIAGIVGPANRTAKDVCDSLPVDVFRFGFETIQYLTVVERGQSLFAVGEAGAEGRLPVGAQDAEIAQRKVLQVDFGLAEIKIKQELDRPRV